MLRRATEIIGYAIETMDDRFGEVEDFYFDDEEWAVRYLVVDTRRWLPSPSVLLSPGPKNIPNMTEGTIPFSMTKEKVKNSPAPETEEPVSQQYQKDLFAYYGWPPYWGNGMALGGPAPLAPPLPLKISPKSSPKDMPDKDPHLRSTKEVTGYHVHARDGEIGHVEDMAIEDGTWKVRYLVVETRNWLPGRQVLVSPDWVGGIDWFEREVHFDVGKERIRNSPPLSEGAPLERDYEERLHAYYGLPRYWV